MILSRRDGSVINGVCDQMDGKASPKIGILGGSFNPIHIGHLILAQEALESLGLCEVLFIPCAQPPHKEQSAMADARDRLGMVELAIRNDPRFDASDIEIRRGGVSYTVDTVRDLSLGHPGKELVFIIGSDTLPELRHWRRIGELLRMCRFAAFARPGSDWKKLRPGDLGLGDGWGERLLADCREGRLVDVSSSEIRRRIAEGLSIRYLVPEAVEAYIREHHLYG